MAKLTLTIDDSSPVSRAALWQGRDLVDFFWRSPGDYEGAIVNAKLVRILKGTQNGFCEAGLEQLLYVERLGEQKAGNLLTLQITGNRRHGKAYAARLIHQQQPGKTVGVIAPPPEPWHHAMHNNKTNANTISKIICTSTASAQQCQAWLNEQAISYTGTIAVDATAAVELDQIWSELTHPRVALKDGAELVIEMAEALTAIDVNLGSAGHSLSANLAAMREIARQIRLRDIRGIIVIDALKMKHRTDQAKLLNVLKTAVAEDWRTVHVFGITKLGLIELTRSGDH
jgi:hypothetical protein